MWQTDVGCGSASGRLRRGAGRAMDTQCVWGASGSQLWLWVSATRPECCAHESPAGGAAPGPVGPESLLVSGAPRGHRAARWSANHVNCILGLGLRLPQLRGRSHMEGEKQAASVNFTVNSLQSTPTEGVPVRCQSSTEPRIQGGRGWSGFCDH